MPDWVAQLVGRRQRVRGHHHGADLGAGKPEEQEFRAVGEVQVYLVTLPHPVLQQPVGGAVDHLVELLIRERVRLLLMVLEY